MPREPLQFNKPTQPEDVAPRITPKDVVQKNKERSQQLFPGIQHWQNLQGNIKTVVTVPTAVPKTIAEGILIYMDDLASPTTKRLYIYSRDADTWLYVALT